MQQRDSSLRRSLRSSSSTKQSASAIVPDGPSSSSSVRASSSKKRKAQQQPSVETKSGKKTPKAPKQEETQLLQPDSADNKYLVKNLSTTFKDLNAGRRSQAINFKLNILKPLKNYRPDLPRYKRTPVQNPALCADVAENILDMCFEQEGRYFTKNNFMAHQPNLNWRMREILIDWVVDVHTMMKLAPPTLWLTVNLIDRTLAKCTITRSRLQLVGIGALSMACKLEEIAVPYPDDFTYITEDAYNLQDLLDMELMIWKAANYELIVPTGYNFLVHYLDTLHASDVTRNLALYYAERNLQETTMLSAKPSVYAAACVYAAIAQRIQQDEPVCSDLPSTEPEPSQGPMASILASWAQSTAAAATEAGVDAVTAVPVGETTTTTSTSALDGVAEVPAPSQHNVVEAPTSSVITAEAPTAVESTVAQPPETAAGDESGQEPGTLSLPPLDQVSTDQPWAPESDSPSNERRGRCVPTDVTLWGLKLTRRAPVRVTVPNSSQEPPAVARNHVAAFSPLAAAYGDVITAGAAPGLYFPTPGVADSGPSGAASSAAGRSSSYTLSSVHCARTEPYTYEEDVTEDEIRRGAEKIAQEISPKDVRALPHLAKAIIAITGGTTMCGQRRLLNAAFRKYAAAKCLCVAHLPEPFKGVSTASFNSVVIETAAGSCHLRHPEASTGELPAAGATATSTSSTSIVSTSSNTVDTTSSGSGSSSNSSSSAAVVETVASGAPTDDAAAGSMAGSMAGSNQSTGASRAARSTKRARAAGSSSSRRSSKAHKAGGKRVKPVTH